MAAAFQKESLYNCKRGCENLAQVEYVQLLVFQMNSHRIDLQLEEQNNNIDYKLLESHIEILFSF